MKMMKIPLVTDLDGTLVQGDTLVEGLRLLLVSRPWMAAALPFWVLGGRPFFKLKLAAWSARACSRMPLNIRVLALLEQEAVLGRPVCLATAACETVAQAMAQRWPHFDTILATTAGHNLKSRHKAEALVRHYGEYGFDYIGDSLSDIAVWKKARVAYVIGNSLLYRKALAANKQAILIEPVWDKGPIC